MVANLPPVREIRWFHRRLLEWFKSHGRDFPWRDESATAYIKILSEVLLQRTRAEVVAGFLPRFLEHFPTWDHLATATEEDLRQFLQPIGLWRRRAASLEKLAREMSRRGGEFPSSREEIEELPGVGQYIANAILLFCFAEPQPLLDVNMARVLERFFGPRKLADIRYDPYLQELSRIVIGREPILTNWAILDHAALVCKPLKPLCEICPVCSKCKYARDALAGADL